LLGSAGEAEDAVQEAWLPHRCHYEIVGRITFSTRLEPRGPAAAVVLDDEQVALVGEGAKRFPVVATVNGYTWRTSVARMGGEFLVGLNREVRERAGVQAGDEVEVILDLDMAPRQVEVPEALAAALEIDPQARVAFEGMAFSHRKEYARWIAEAKREETRGRRVQQALEMIRAGKTRS
jgi:bifunctional DNA-binding transcriptional regulator/antitoxin component of YhaV-PrlF toxin-antitoxin module